MKIDDMHLPASISGEDVSPLLAVSVLMMEERTAPRVGERALAMLRATFPDSAWALLTSSLPSQYDAITTPDVGIGAMIELGERALDARATVSLTNRGPATAPAGSLRYSVIAGPVPRQPRVALGVWGLTREQLDDASLAWLARLFAAARDTVEEVESLRAESNIDALTGLLNRRSIERSLEREWAATRRYGTELSVLFFDLDRFKVVNDTHGHAVGDEVLRAVAQRLREEVRGVDLVGRLGGDEFLVLLPQTTLREAEEIGRRLAARINAVPVATDAGPIEASATFGAASAASAADASELLDRADKGMLGRKRPSRQSAA